MVFTMQQVTKKYAMGAVTIRLFGIATVDRGDHRSEFKRIFDYRFMAGMEYDF